MVSTKYDVYRHRIDYEVKNKNDGDKFFYAMKYDGDNYLDVLELYFYKTYDRKWYCNNHTGELNISNFVNPSKPDSKNLLILDCGERLFLHIGEILVVPILPIHNAVVEGIFTEDEFHKRFEIVDNRDAIKRYLNSLYGVENDKDFKNADTEELLNEKYDNTHKKLIKSYRDIYTGAPYNAFLYSGSDESNKVLYSLLTVYGREHFHSPLSFGDYVVVDVINNVLSVWKPEEFRKNFIITSESIREHIENLADCYREILLVSRDIGGRDLEARLIFDVCYELLKELFGHEQYISRYNKVTGEELV